jgi:hypothetical protein
MIRGAPCFFGLRQRSRRRNTGGFREGAKTTFLHFFLGRLLGSLADMAELLTFCEPYFFTQDASLLALTEPNFIRRFHSHRNSNRLEELLNEPAKRSGPEGCEKMRKSSIIQ